MRQACGSARSSVARIRLGAAHIHDRAAVRVQRRHDDSVPPQPAPPPLAPGHGAQPQHKHPGHGLYRLLGVPGAADLALGPGRLQHSVGGGPGEPCSLGTTCDRSAQSAARGGEVVGTQGRLRASSTSTSSSSSSGCISSNGSSASSSGGGSSNSNCASSRGGAAVRRGGAWASVDGLTCRASSAWEARAAGAAAAAVGWVICDGAAASTPRQQQGPGAQAEAAWRWSLLSVEHCLQLPVDGPGPGLNSGMAGAGPSSPASRSAVFSAPPGCQGRVGAGAYPALAWPRRPAAADCSSSGDVQGRPTSSSGSGQRGGKHRPRPCVPTTSSCPSAAAFSPAPVQRNGEAMRLSGRGAGAPHRASAGLLTRSPQLQGIGASGPPLVRRTAALMLCLSLQAGGAGPLSRSPLARPSPSHLPLRSISTTSTPGPEPSACQSALFPVDGRALEPPPPSSPPAPAPPGSSLFLPSPGSPPPGEHPSPEMGLYSYRMSLRYDGTAYSGWQLQPAAPTIQAALEAALSTALREGRDKLKVGSAGRTDAGVHAEGQVVHFYSDHDRLMERASDVTYRVNRLLPEDIRVSALRRTAPDFNATISSTSKTYHYYVDCGTEHHPMSRRYRLHHPAPLDLARMRQAAAAVPGTHDFTRFSNLVPEKERRNPVKTMRRLDLVELGAGEGEGERVLRLEFEGEGFLYKMVRHLTGALLAVGRGKLAPGFVEQQLRLGSSGEQAVRGTYRGYQVAPAKGLVLFQVVYPPEADDPTRLLYPHLPHDQYGRLLDVSMQSICPSEE